MLSGGDQHVATLTQYVKTEFVDAADTGSLRGDVIDLLKLANKLRVRLAMLVFTQLGGFYRDASTTLPNSGPSSRVVATRCSMR